MPLGLAKIDHDGLASESATSDGAVDETRQQLDATDNFCRSFEAQPDPQTERKTHKGDQCIRKPLPPTRRLTAINAVSSCGNIE